MTSDDWSRDELLDGLMEEVYGELHRRAENCMRGQPGDHTLQPSALINEAYLKLNRAGSSLWRDRTRFLATASQAMRQVLIDHAERRAAIKRGGDAQFVTFEESALGQTSNAEQLLSLNQALERLGEHDPRLVQIVEYRFFAGLKHDEIAALLGVSVPTVKREWRAARAWLRDALDGGGVGGAGEHAG
jgi:RNA polymerase sigma factor (TIGR02999 family)